jgi:crossover junction endodeoxyribonuclease RuvC
MIILGIDGGMVRLGLGVVKIENDSISLGSYGVIETPRNELSYNDFLTAGITRITNDFPRYLDLARPDLIISETIPPGKLGSSDSQVIAAVTTCRVVAIQFGLPWKNIAANTVKKGLTGDGRATKARVRNEILALFPEMQTRHEFLKKQQKQAGEKRIGIPQDCFDALAVAYVGSKLIDDNNT